MINMKIKVAFICCVVYILKADMKCHNINYTLYSLEFYWFPLGHPLENIYLFAVSFLLE